MKNDKTKAAIPMELLENLYIPWKTKEALARGVCPECSMPLEVVDTWERACSTPTCGYTFNWYAWPCAPLCLPPEIPKL